MNKILHIISSLDVGGAEMMLYRLVREGTNHPCDQHIVISLLPKGELFQKYQSLGIDLFMLDIKNKPFSTCWKIIDIIRGSKPDIVQTWMYHSNFIGGVIAKFLGCKNIFWGLRRTDLPKENRYTYFLMKILAPLSYVIPKKIICVADSSKKIHSSEGYSYNKMVTISNGYDFSFLVRDSGRDIRKFFNVDNDLLIVGCLGRFHKDKGQDLFLEAVKDLPKDKYKFMLVGRGCDWENEKLVSNIHKYNLSRSFILVGEKLDIAKYLSAFDIFCMPSRTEGFPNALAEAMAMELPCVGFDVGDAHKLNGEGVELVKPNDVKELKSRIEMLSQLSKEKRKQLGKKASDRVRKDFSIEETYQKHMFVYRN